MLERFRGGTVSGLQYPERWLVSEAEPSRRAVLQVSKSQIQSPKFQGSSPKSDINKSVLLSVLGEVFIQIADKMFALLNMLNVSAAPPGKRD